LERQKASVFLNTLSQIAVVVDNVRFTAESLSNLLGIGPWKFEDWPPENRKNWQSSYNGKPHKWKTKLAFANFNNIEIELIENVEGESAYSQFLREKGKGIHHLLFEVEELDAVVSELKSKGVKEKMGATGRKPGTRWVLMNTIDLLGFDIELKNRT